MAGKRKASSSLPTPARSAKKPKMGGGRKYNFGGTARKLFSTAGKLGKSIAPYVGAVDTAYSGYKLLRGLRRGYRRQSKGSASNSKSRGRFAPPKKYTTKSDEYSEKGIVRKLEAGNVVTESGRPVVYLAHSTMPAQQVMYACIGALLKKLFNEAKHRVKNENEVLFLNQYFDSQVTIGYKVKDGDSVQEQNFAVSATTGTLNTVTGAVYSWLNGLSESANLPNQFLYLRLFEKRTGVFTELMLFAELDLTTVKFDVYSRSHLKIQNRTINSAENDQADDVDNVPINGKYFEFATNGTIYRDYAAPGSSGTANITTSPFYGLLPTTIGSDTDTGMYKELPDRTQFVGCKLVGKSHLDPGEIKTSTMTDELKISLQQLITKVFARKPSTGAGRFAQFWLGKTRLFGWEKMVNAVAMSATNQFNIAFEHQYEIGAIAMAKRSYHTAPIVQEVTPAVVS